MGDNTIDLRLHYNTGCLKCQVVAAKMVRIGAFVMCHRCCEQEFGKNIDKIDCDSDLYKITYHKWLKKYQS